jgi:hypothetical protein
VTKTLGFLLAFAFTAVGFMAREIWNGLTVEAAGDGRGAGTPSGNGDVNGDGEINIADPVYTLNWLFVGGPTPVPIACPPPQGGALPATDQKVCYGWVEPQGWVEVPCDEACAGQDGSYAAGCSSEGRFVDNLDGTVTDNCTRLTWQKDTADTNGDGQTPDDGSDALPWCSALAYCESLSFAGHDDWRLPNLRELESIVDYGRYKPAIDPVFGALSSWYWSSTSIAGDPDVAWNVNFSSGHVYYNIGGKDYNSYVRAVRSGP